MARTRMDGRLEVRIAEEDREQIERAADLDGLPPATWARRTIIAAAADRLARARVVTPPAPTAEDVADALRVHGSMKGARARRFRERVARLARDARWEP